MRVDIEALGIAEKHSPNNFGKKRVEDPNSRLSNSVASELAKATCSRVKEKNPKCYSLVRNSSSLGRKGRITVQGRMEGELHFL